MSIDSQDSPRRERRHFSAAQKAALVKRHLVDKVPVSDLCDEAQITPPSSASGRSSSSRAPRRPLSRRSRASRPGRRRSSGGSLQRSGQALCFCRAS